MFQSRHMAMLLLSFFIGVIPLGAQSPKSCLGGRLDAPIRMEVFSDFQCPHCQEFFLNTVRPILKDYSTRNKVCVIYREFPLVAIHPYALKAARYSLAARKLGPQKWLAVIDSIYTSQPKWSQDGKIEAAVYKALSPDDFQKLKRNLEDPSIDKLIQDDIRLGQERRIRQTPTFFLHYLGKEQRVEPPIPYPVLKDFFDQIVK